MPASPSSLPRVSLFLPLSLQLPSSQDGGSQPEPLLLPKLGLRTRWETTRADFPPHPHPRSQTHHPSVLGPPGRRGCEGVEAEWKARSPLVLPTPRPLPGPVPTVLAAGIAGIAGRRLHEPWAHAPTRADGARAPGLRSRWLRLVPGVREAAGVGTQGGEDDAPQKGWVRGEESPRVLGNSESGAPAPPPPPPTLLLPQRGARPLGAKAAGLREGVTAPRPAQAAGGGSPGSTTLRSWDWHPVPSPVTALMGPRTAGERAVFWPRWK